MKPENMPKADFVVSLILMAFGSGIIVQAFRMPRFQNLGANPFSVPGIVPGILGGVIFILSAVVFFRSLRRQGYRLGWNKPMLKAFAVDPDMRRMLLTTLLCMFYGIGLVGRLNYYLATFLFVLAFIVLFQYRTAAETPGRGRLLLASLVQAVLTAAVVGAVFRYLFLVELP
jgi:hypothetical protein